MARNCCPKRVRKKKIVKRQKSAITPYVATGMRSSIPWIGTWNRIKSSIAYWIDVRSTVFRSPYPCGSTMDGLWNGSIEPIAKRKTS